MDKTSDVDFNTAVDEHKFSPSNFTLRRLLRKRAVKMFGDANEFRFVAFAGDYVRLNPSLLF